ncbi:MAG: ABC transporter substrate-binding protein [bacterium]|nr:ABC transporter substrate-binding protein [bacterium]
MKKCFRFFFVILCFLCLAGCGGQSGDASGSVEPETEKQDWKAVGFSVAGEVQEEQRLWPEKYLPWQHEEPPYDVETDVPIRHMTEEKGVVGGKLYRQHTYTGTEPEHQKEYLEIYDTATGTTEIIELNPENVGAEAVGDGAIVKLAVVSEGEYAVEVVRLTSDGNGSVGLAGADMVYSDLHGTVSDKSDVLSVFEEKKIAEVGRGSFFFGNYSCDGAGNLYVLMQDDYNLSKVLYVIDREGSLLGEQIYTQNQTVGSFMRTPEGELLFPVYDSENRSTDIVWFDPQSKKPKVLAQLEGEPIVQMYGMQGNILYYKAARGIVGWDTVSGERTLVYAFDENAVPAAFDTAVAFDGDSAPVLRMYGSVNEEEEDWLSVLSSERIERADEIRIVSLEGGSSAKVQACAAVASRRNPNYRYRYESGEGQDPGDFRTAILAEIVAGGGPDILYVTDEDMEMLQAQGALLDLESLLSSEALEEVLPGALELGRMQGTLAGIPPEISPATLITLNAIWQEKTWRLDDILDLMDTGEYIGIICQGTGAFASRALLSWLTSYSLEDSSFIDWETGECHFEDERFLRVLRAAKQFGETEPDRTTYGLRPGKCIADVLAGSSLKQFNDNYAKFGENYFFVGLPTEGDCGNYLYGDGMVVVNRNTAEPEAVATFLECLIGEEIQNGTYGKTQISTHLSVRRIDTEELRYDEDGQRAWWNGQEVTVKEDGSTTLHDFAAFLENCVPGPKRYPELEEIIWEEAQGYLEGDKKAEDAADIIDRKIQVYLDERR